MQSFSNFIQQERERLHAEREQIFNQQQELERKLADFNRELVAIDAYETAKSGKATTPRTRTVTGTRSTRRSGVRDQVLQVVKSKDGVTSADIRKALGITDKSGSQSVSNALSALKKAGQIGTTSTGAYVAA